MLDTNSKKKFILIGVIVIIGATLGIYLSKKTGNKEASLKVPSILWGQALDQINQAWSGDFSLTDEHLLKNCPFLKMKDSEAKEVSSVLKACRPELFRCYYEDRKVTLKNKNQYFNLEVKVESDSLSQGTNGLPLTLKLGNLTKRFELTRFCRQQELPQGAYWGSNKNEKDSRLWHTSGIRYFVDKTLVRNLEVRNWLEKEKGGVPELKKVTERYRKLVGRELFAPSGDLTPELMQDFCSERGQEVLSSRVKSAITFHHGRRREELIKRDPPSYNTSPHPFGPRLQDSPQYLAEKKVDLDLSDSCRKIFSKECLEEYKRIPKNENTSDLKEKDEKQPWSLYKSWGMGWTGISEVLGGPAEYVVNREFPRKNLHPSSYYHTLSSKVHQAGVRVFWSGRGHRRIDFNFFTSPFFEVGDDRFDVGFRCMKKVFDEVQF